MVSEHKLYLMREKAREDKLQTRLGKNGNIEPSLVQNAMVEHHLDCAMMVSCPFCLYDDKLQAFLISTAKGLSRSRAECPECHNGMMMESLTADWTPEQYAEWVYDYRRFGFWKKIDFPLWSQRLYNRGWSQRFFSKYRELKGNDDEEEWH